MTTSARGDYARFVFTDADKSKVIYVETSFTPGRARITSTQNSDAPVLDWNASLDSGNSADGGVLTDKTSSVTRELLAAASGVTTYAGGGLIVYNDATTPTYKDGDGTSFTDTILDTDGNNILTTNMPAVAAGDNGASHRRGRALKINAITKLRTTNSDELVIEIWKD